MLFLRPISLAIALLGCAPQWLSETENSRKALQKARFSLATKPVYTRPEAAPRWHPLLRYQPNAWQHHQGLFAFDDTTTRLKATGALYRELALAHYPGLKAAGGFITDAIWSKLPGPVPISTFLAPDALKTQAEFIASRHQLDAMQGAQVHVLSDLEGTLVTRFNTTQVYGGGQSPVMQTLSDVTRQDLWQIRQAELSSTATRLADVDASTAVKFHVITHVDGRYSDPFEDARVLCAHDVHVLAYVGNSVFECNGPQGEPRGQLETPPDPPELFTDSKNAVLASLSKAILAKWLLKRLPNTPNCIVALGDQLGRLSSERVAAASETIRDAGPADRAAFEGAMAWFDRAAPAADDEGLMLTAAAETPSCALRVAVTPYGNRSHNTATATVANHWVPDPASALNVLETVGRALGAR